jgi:hypothetical protein
LKKTITRVFGTHWVGGERQRERERERERERDRKRERQGGRRDGEREREREKRERERERQRERRERRAAGAAVAEIVYLVRFTVVVFAELLSLSKGRAGRQAGRELPARTRYRVVHSIGK